MNLLMDFGFTVDAFDDVTSLAADRRCHLRRLGPKKSLTSPYGGPVKRQAKVTPYFVGLVCRVLK